MQDNFTLSAGQKHYYALKNGKMRISTLSTKLSLILLGNLFCVASIAIEKRDADFNNVRTNLQKNFNNENPKEPNKYFHEARFDPHYDGRFTDGRLPCK